MSTTPNRRSFIKHSLQAAAGIAAASLPEVVVAGGHHARRPIESAKKMNTPSAAQTLRFSVIGINHSHIHSQIDSLVRNGGQLISFFAKEPELASAFSKRYPQAKQAN